MLPFNDRFGKRFDTTLLIQSAVMIITQSILLETVVRHRTPEKHESEPLKDQEQRRLRWYDTFWQWPHYLDYVNCLLGFTTVVGVAYVLLGKLPWFVEALGIISLGIESTLPLPQCISNFKTRSTAGFSLIVLATWVSHQHYSIVSGCCICSQQRPSSTAPCSFWEMHSSSFTLSTPTLLFNLICVARSSFRLIH